MAAVNHKPENVMPFALFQKLLGTFELGNRDPTFSGIGTFCSQNRDPDRQFMKIGVNRGQKLNLPKVLHRACPYNFGNHIKM